MSVLVEALSLIIPRTVLDASYPGGTDTFMKKMCEPDIPCRLVCADDALVSASFCGPAEAGLVSDQLLELGIVALYEDQFRELALVDQFSGPTMPCEWLEWRRHQDGFTSCWLVGSNPDPMHVPDNWAPDISRTLRRQAARREPDGYFWIGNKDGREFWLDLQTGEISESPACGADTRSITLPTSAEQGRTMANVPEFNGEFSHTDDSLLAIVRSMLDGFRYKYRMIDPRSLTFTIRNEGSSYAIFFTANDETNFVRLVASYGSNVPLDRRVAIAEAVSRVNCSIRLGNFELDFADGELRFRVSMDVEGGKLSGKMTDNMLGIAMHTMERYHLPFMRVAFGDVEPSVALDAAA